MSFVFAIGAMLKLSPTVYLKNQEYKAALGVVTGMAVLAVKIYWRMR